MNRTFISLWLFFVILSVLMAVTAFTAGLVIIFVISMFIGFLLLLIYTYLRIVSGYIEVTREHNPSAVEGEEFYVKTSVANFSYLPVFFLKIEDTFPAGRLFSLDHLITEPLMSRSVYEYTARSFISKHMGTYSIGPVKLTFSGPFGIFSIKKTIALDSELTVYPSLQTPEYMRLMCDPVLTRVGREIISASGYSTDFKGQREYRKEDPKHLIHWKSTARHRKLVVKEFDENAVTDISILVDYRAVSLRGTGNSTTHELALRCAASVAAAASEKYHRFRITCIGLRDSQQTGLQFGTGDHHLHTALQALVRLPGPGPYSDFCSHAVSELNRLKRGSTAVFIVNQTPTDMQGLENLAALCRRKGVYPVIMLINDRTFIKLHSEQLEHERQASDFSRVCTRFYSEGIALYPVSRREGPGKVLGKECIYNSRGRQISW